MHGFQNPADADRSFDEDGRFPSSRNRRHSAKPEPASRRYLYFTGTLPAVSALAGECRAIAKGVGSILLGMAGLYLAIFAYGAVA